MSFVGPFDLDAPFDTPISLYNSGFRMETELFWLGYDKVDWETETRRIWTDACTQARTILDIGANTGLFAIFAKAANPDARVLAFEPQPNIFAALEHNVEASGFAIGCYRYALCDRDGEMPFYNYGDSAFSGNTTAGSLNQQWRPSNQRRIDVPTRRLESFATESSLGKIDLMKIDVETYEPKVIEGCGNLIEQDRPTILLEIQNVELGRAIEALLPTGAYSYFCIDESDGLRPCSHLGRSEQLNYFLVPRSEGLNSPTEDGSASH